MSAKYWLILYLNIAMCSVMLSKKTTEYCYFQIHTNNAVIILNMTGIQLFVYIPEFNNVVMTKLQNNKNKAIRDGKYLARHIPVLGNVHPIKIELLYY